jgi:hypothetical protein
MTKQKLPKKIFDKLEKIDVKITDKKKFQDWLTENQIINKKNIRTVTEAALIGGYCTRNSRRIGHFKRWSKTI